MVHLLCLGAREELWRSDQPGQHVPALNMQRQNGCIPGVVRVAGVACRPTTLAERQELWYPRRLPLRYFC